MATTASSSSCAARSSRATRCSTPIRRHLKETCDHHGGVGWVIGLDDRQPYRVLELREPQRIVIDVRHNGR
jgi:hypothetical protein